MRNTLFEEAERVERDELKKALEEAKNASFGTTVLGTVHTKVGRKIYSLSTLPGLAHLRLSKEKMKYSRSSC